MSIDKYYYAINYNEIDNKFINDYNEDKYLKESKLSNFVINNERKNDKNEKNVKTMIFDKFKNYKYLCCVSYTVIELKNILKKFNQHITGKKIDLYKRIYLYMYLMYSCIYIQRNYRNSIITKLNYLHGPARINRNLCVNDTDFYSLDYIKDIEYQNFYSYKDDSNFIYGFDIKSIYNLLKRNKIENPYTLKKFDQVFIDNVNNFVYLSKIANYNIDININDLYVLNYNQKLINLFHEIDLLGNYTNVEWFKNLNTRKKLFFLKELHDIWNYRANIDIYTKQQIYPYGDPFLNLNLNNIYNNYYPTENFNNICINILENFILYGINSSSKSLGALYILSALTIVSKEAAESLPWLYESVSYN
tara:strand:- start:1826 stop:2911 length:1086 start_codon:yes stop_codon:yes gene_type:complete